MSASSSASENTPQKLHALGRMGRKVALIGSLLSASFAIDADAANTSNAPVPMDLHDNLPPKVSDGYIKPYKANHLREVVAMVQEPSPYDASFQEAEEMYGVPADMIKLYAVNESRLKPDAQSPTGPLGICQFTKKTARWSGLTVDPENGHDERLNPHESILAMGKLMAHYLGRTGGRFFSENGKWGAFEYLHGDDP